MSEWIDSRHLLDSSGFHVPTALPFYLLGAHEWLNWNPGCQFSLRNSLLILKEEEVMLGGKSFSLNPCRITKNKFMTMSAVFMSSFSFEIYVVRLAVDWGMLVNQYRWRCWLNPGLFFFFFSLFFLGILHVLLWPWSHRLLSDQCLMKMCLL